MRLFQSDRDHDGLGRFATFLTRSSACGYKEQCGLKTDRVIWAPFLLQKTAPADQTIAKGMRPDSVVCLFVFLASLLTVLGPDHSQ